jgi:hypothetical protein
MWLTRKTILCFVDRPSWYMRAAQKVMPHIFFLGNYLFRMFEIHAQYNWMFPLHMWFFHIISIYVYGLMSAWNKGMYAFPVLTDMTTRTGNELVQGRHACPCFALAWGRRRRWRLCGKITCVKETSSYTVREFHTFWRNSFREKKMWGITFWATLVIK